MSKHRVRPTGKGDDFMSAYGPDFEAEMFDDIQASKRPYSHYSRRAWRHLERRAESRWLRDQLVDWDDGDNGDEFLEAH